MSRFIAKPNLPDSKVKTLICGELPDEIVRYFKSRNIYILKIKKIDGIDKAISNHADIAVLHLGNEKIIVEKRQTELIEELKEIGFDVLLTNDIIEGEYPNDIKLNFMLVAECLLGNLQYGDITLKGFYSKFTCLNTRQGYTKCSCLAVKEDAIITDDLSIHRVACENGIDSLLISKGDINLNGHDYGFIGGASGKLSENEVVFFGDITKHRDFDRIKDFLKKYNCNIISFEKMPLVDCGGIIPIITE